MEWLGTVLQAMSLKLNERKSANLMLSPTLIEGGIYRKSPNPRMLSTNRRLRDLYGRVTRNEVAVVELNPFEDTRIGAWGRKIGGYPFPAVAKTV